MTVCYIFDSYALLALLEDEPGADLVTELISDRKTEAYISAINLGEIYYLLLRRSGVNQAERVLESITLEDSISIAEASWERIKEASKVKAGGGLSFADAFAVALAKELEAPLVTGDPEIIEKAEANNIQVIAI
jgi:PIN domain nuclease of toxin-antitoxin system